MAGWGWCRLDSSSDGGGGGEVNIDARSRIRDVSVQKKKIKAYVRDTGRLCVRRAQRCSAQDGVYDILLIS